MARTGTPLLASGISLAAPPSRCRGKNNSTGIQEADACYSCLLPYIFFEGLLKALIITAY
jgi:hypothetical protein